MGAINREESTALLKQLGFYFPIERAAAVLPLTILIEISDREIASHPSKSQLKSLIESRIRGTIATASSSEHIESIIKKLEKDEHL